MEKTGSLKDDLKKLGGAAFEKAFNYLEKNFPFYDKSSNTIRIPEKTVENFLKSKCSEIPEIHTVDLACRDGFMDLKLTGAKSYFSGTMNLKCYLERFEIKKDSQIAEIRFGSNTRIKGTGFFGRMALFLAQGLITGMVEDRLRDVAKSSKSENLVQFDWPRAKIFISNFPAVRKLTEKTIMGINILDFVEIGRPTVIEGYVTVKPDTPFKLK